MVAVPSLTPNSASPLDADPQLARVIGRRDAARLARTLPVLAVAAGPWTPPEAADCGPGTVALVILEGFLLGADRALSGRDDVIAPWGGSWHACTALRLAVIGQAHREALAPWPQAQRRTREPGPSVAARDGGALEERLLDLLWRLALRWGRFDGRDVRLPGDLDRHILGLALDAEPPDTARALAALGENGVSTARDGSIVLTGGVSDSHRDAMRARAATRLAQARAAVGDSAALLDDLDETLRRRDALRARGGAG